MLRELRSARQIPDEPYRRWFFSHELDLVVWFDEAGQPIGFQLAYDKYRDEHSISWHAERGYRHYVVDEGNQLAGDARTPLLYADGSFDAARVAGLFAMQAVEIPEPIVRFVTEKLSSYSPDG